MILRLLCLLLAALAALPSTSSLKVMTFNIWLSGEEVTDGLTKIAKHIRLVNPDIVALQEVETPAVVPNITRLLGPPWSGIHHCNSTYPDTAILTKHTIIPGTYTHVDYGMSVKIQLEGTRRQVTVWSLHLEYHSYGPYAAYNKMVDSEAQILAGEFPTKTRGRVHNIIQLLVSPEFRQDVAKSAVVPLIVAGDFNAPSDLDWTEANRAKHGGWVFPWPATKLLRELSGVKDSFRELYPDPVTHPGYTWSTVNKFQKEWDYTIPEPMDRIDFINYLGPLKPVSAGAYGGNSTLTPIPKQWGNDYPSDHYAFITDFEDVALDETVTEVVMPPLPSQLTDRLYRARETMKGPTPICSDNIFTLPMPPAPPAEPDAPESPEEPEEEEKPAPEGDPEAAPPATEEANLHHGSGGQQQPPLPPKLPAPDPNTELRSKA